MARTKQTARKSTGGKLPIKNASKHVKSDTLANEERNKKLKKSAAIAAMTVAELKKLQKTYGIKDSDIKGTGANRGIVKADRVKAVKKHEFSKVATVPMSERLGKASALHIAVSHCASTCSQQFPLMLASEGIAVSPVKKTKKSLGKYAKPLDVDRTKGPYIIVYYGYKISPKQAMKLLPKHKGNYDTYIPMRETLGMSSASHIDMYTLPELDEKTSNMQTGSQFYVHGIPIDSKKLIVGIPITTLQVYRESGAITIPTVPRIVKDSVKQLAIDHIEFRGLKPKIQIFLDSGR